MENLQRDWKRFVQQSQKSQEVVGQLSKLYIILHENVRQTILKSTIHHKYNPTQDCHNHLKIILDILKRMNDPADSYLNGVDSNILNKFQEQLYDLSEQVQKLLKTYDKTTGIDVKKLQGIKRQNDKEEYGLKDQLRKSQQRRLRSRSGKRNSRPNTRQGANPNNEIIDQFSEYKTSFKQKQSKLQEQMEGHIEKKNNKLIFANKYSGSNLEDYFKLRKELFDLQIADQYTQKIVIEHDTKNVNKVHEGKKEQLENKLFGEFKIKTKYMKQNVKQNILKALVDVKTKLLEEYHHSNMKRLKEGNPDTLITLVNPKKKTENTTKDTLKKKLSTKKHISSASTLHQIANSPSLPSARPMRQASLTRYPMAHKTHRPNVYKAGWTDAMEEQFRETMTFRFTEGKVPNTARS